MQIKNQFCIKLNKFITQSYCSHKRQKRKIDLLSFLQFFFFACSYFNITETLAREDKMFNASVIKSSLKCITYVYILRAHKSWVETSSELFWFHVFCHMSVFFKVFTFSSPPSPQITQFWRATEEPFPFPRGDNRIMILYNHSIKMPNYFDKNRHRPFNGSFGFFSFLSDKQWSFQYYF